MNNKTSKLLDQFTSREKFMFLCGFTNGNHQGVMAVLNDYDPDKAVKDSAKITDITNEILNRCIEKMNLNIEHTNELDYGLLELSDEINEMVISFTKESDDKSC